MRVMEEMLDKERFLRKHYKNRKTVMRVFTIMLVCAVGIGLVMSLISKDFFMLEIFSFTFGGLYVIFMPMLLFPNIKAKRDLEKIKRESHKYEEIVFPAKIISKALESTVNVRGNHMSTSSSTQHVYNVGVRNLNNNDVITLESRELYMGVPEGEVVDIKLKRKLSKYGEVIDYSFIPLLNTVRTMD